MGRLFWKFFVAYWAAILVAVISIGAAAWLYRLAEEEIDPSIEVGPRASYFVRSGERALREGGLPALRARMERWSRRGPILLFAVDSGSSFSSRAGRCPAGPP